MVARNERKMMMKEDELSGEDVGQEDDGRVECCEEEDWLESMAYARQQDFYQACCDPLFVYDEREWLNVKLDGYPEESGSIDNDLREAAVQAVHGELWRERYQEKAQLRTILLGLIVAAAIVVVFFFLPEIIGLTH